MKKKINILLIILVASLWGGVFYKIVKQFFIKEEVQLQTYSKKANINLNFTKKDTFAFVQSTRDPFLNRQSSGNSIKIITENKPKLKQIQRPAPVQVQKAPARMFPSVMYFGYMSSGTDKESALLKINHKQVKLSLNEEYEGLKLLKIYRDSVEVLFNKNKVMIRKAR